MCKLFFVHWCIIEYDYLQIPITVLYHSFPVLNSSKTDYLRTLCMKYSQRDTNLLLLYVLTIIYITINIFNRIFRYSIERRVYYLSLFAPGYGVYVIRYSNRKN